PTPVSLGDAWTGDPDLADLVRCTALVRGRIGDHHAHVLRRPPAGREAHDVLAVTVDDPVHGERPRTDPDEMRRVSPTVARDCECCLGQAVPRPERLPAEPGRPEGGIEAMECLGPDWLGAVVGDAPAAEVEAAALLGRRATDAKIVGEVGAAALGP